jgi:hypothetical protein
VELFLNLAGASAAIALFCLWLWSARSANSIGANRKTQLVALVLLILIIFPIISVTDDLLAAANPAETDVLLRRDHEFSGFIAAIPPVLHPDESALPEAAATRWRLIASLLQFSLPDAPALAPIENRPPPAA